MNLNSKCLGAIVVFQVLVSLKMNIVEFRSENELSNQVYMLLYLGCMQ